jgi:hypothetical protein
MLIREKVYGYGPLGPLFFAFERFVSIGEQVYKRFYDLHIEN